MVKSTKGGEGGKITKGIRRYIFIHYYIFVEYIFLF